VVRLLAASAGHLSQPAGEATDRAPSRSGRRTTEQHAAARERRPSASKSAEKRGRSDPKRSCSISSPCQWLGSFFDNLDPAKAIRLERAAASGSPQAFIPVSGYLAGTNPSPPALNRGIGDSGAAAFLHPAVRSKKQVFTMADAAPTPVTKTVPKPRHQRLRDMADCIRFLSMDAVQQAKSGHPGAPLGMADIATVLFRDFMQFDAADPH
jgi:Transketolase, thiamine diphosphate binding domain